MNTQPKFFCKAIAVTLLAGLTSLAIGGLAVAGEVSSQQIVDGLKVTRTRGLSIPDRPALTADDVAFVKGAQNRGLSAGDRDQMAEIAAKRPKIDLDINFEYDSAALSPKADPQLDNLGKALTSPEMAGSVIMLGGHTDGKGSDDYNQKLSERRAETIKRFLMENYRIPAANLLAAGYGKKGMKNAADPLAAENRRVEIVNMAEREQASK